MKKFGAILLTMSFVIGTFSTVFADVQPRYGNTGYVYYCVGRGYSSGNKYINTSTEAGIVQDYIQSWGYDCGPYNFFENADPDEYTEGRLNSPIIYFAGHGSPTNIDCGGSGVTIEDRFSPFVNINDFNFNEVDIAFLAGCRTSSITESVAKKFVTNGAVYSIGWVGSPATAHMRYFTEAYFDALDKGCTFEQAEECARVRMHDFTAGQETEDIYSYKSYGDGSAKPDTSYGPSYGRNAEDVTLLDLFINDDMVQHIVNENVIYEPSTHNYAEIEEYIKENINSNFNIDEYEINEETTDVFEKDVTVLMFNYKIGDVLTDFAYKVIIEGNKAILITQIGEDISNKSFDMSEETYVEDAVLYQMATDEIENVENIDSQKTYKYFDSELEKIVYVVETVVGTDETGYSNYRFEYSA